MAKLPAHWAVLCDFDGTISQLDVGNEIHRSVFPDEFLSLQKSYRSGDLNLRQLQLAMWKNFPLNQKEFCRRAETFATFRPGFREFLRYCHKKNVSFIVASCGIRDYIEAVLARELSPEDRQLIAAVHCNDAHFDEKKLTTLITPEDESSDLTLDKGKLARELRHEKPALKILGIGNGTSDRSMAGHVDRLAATDALARWAESSHTAHIAFDDFETLIEAAIFE